MARRALIVIDVQNEYFDGALPVTDPPTATSLPNIVRAMDGATAAGVPVIVVQHADGEPDSPIFRPGTHAQELHPTVAGRQRDHLIEKAYPGTFTDTPLADVLTAAGIDTVSIIGYMTHMCVDTTARQAAHRGLAVEILNDATGTLALENSGGAATGEELHRATLVAQGQFFADVTTTDDWLARVATEDRG
jgi:nicotinamidase-related amidase